MSLITGLEKPQNVTNFVNSLLAITIDHNGSDIHFDPFLDKVLVKIRVDGILQEMTKIEPSFYISVVARIKILCNMDITKTKIPQDGRFSHIVNDQKYDCRVSTMPVLFAERVVIRILGTTKVEYSLTEIGFSDDELSKIKKVLSSNNGLVLVTGPTGCGKTTTLYTFLRYVNNVKVNVMTIEDPVEYDINGVNQIPIRYDAQMSYISILRSIIRQDPNIIMLGEVRDVESAETAVRMAITGHLVMSSLHTTDAAMVVERLCDMGIGRNMIADVLKCVIAQRLVRKLCPYCKALHITSEEEMKFLKIQSPITIYESCGCEHCLYTGYNGRVAVQEIIIFDNEIKDAIIMKKSTTELRQIALRRGMRLFSDKCRELAINGISSLEEIARISLD